MIELYNMDCIEAMKEMPDNSFDLAIVDPPYGIKRFTDRGSLRLSACTDKENKTGLLWDVKPNADYFKELFRVSKHQIIWGANNFTLPPSEYFCIWNKNQTVDNFASCEYAWVSMSLKTPAKVFDYSIKKHNHTHKIHPCQKPVPLYRWLLSKYAKEGWSILDTHLGSGSSAIAAHEMDFDFVGFELDKEYFDAAQERLHRHQRQLRLFED